MSWTIELTPQQPATFTLTASLAEQALCDALDVGDCDVLDLELVVLRQPSVPTLTFTLCTGMQTETADGWLDGDVSTDYYDFPAVSVANPRVVRRFSTGLLRFVRWKLRSASSIIEEPVVFYIRGLGRSFGDAGSGPP